VPRQRKGVTIRIENRAALLDTFQVALKLVGRDGFVVTEAGTSSQGTKGLGWIPWVRTSTGVGAGLSVRLAARRTECAI
jgi:hypothetical protein